MIVTSISVIHLASEVALAVSWLCAARVLFQATTYPVLRWAALWTTLIAVMSTLAFIAPAGPMQNSALVGEGIAIVALLLDFWRVRGRIGSSRRGTRRKIEEALERVIADATIFPMNDHTADAKRAVMEGIDNAIDFLKRCHADEDYVMQGPGGLCITWRWQWSEEGVGESLIALTQITYTMLFLAAARALDYPMHTQCVFRIKKENMAALMAFIAYQQPVADFLVAPLPYSQAEYREALSTAWDTVVLPNLSYV